MFRDEHQASRAIRLLLSRCGVDAAWTVGGRGGDAIELRYEDDVALSPAKRILVLAAWSLWSPIAGGVRVADVVRTLDRRSCAALCSLMVAYTEGADAIDAWIGDESAAWSDTSRTALPEARASVLEPNDPLTSIFEGWPTLDLLSARYVRHVVTTMDGNRSRAASLLGVDRRTVSRLLAGDPEDVIPGMRAHAPGARRKAGGR
jgi:hypothetical protein